MKFLLIEDEPDFVARIQAASKQEEATAVMVPEEVGLAQKFDDQGAIEEQLLTRLRKIRDEYGIEIVLLDTDLSKIGNGIGQVACRLAFQELGLPVCRYTKRHSHTPISNLQTLRRLAVEGASAVWVPGEKVKGDLSETGLLSWLRAVNAGFVQLRQVLIEKPELLTRSLGPAGILAHALGRPSLKSELLGYTAQNFFFFAAPLDAESANTPIPEAVQLSTRLGYWLVNYILAFPGPILSKNAAAAYLNLTLKTFEQEVVINFLESARYHGPFSQLDEFYWAEDLLELISDSGGDIAKADELAGVELERVDKENVESSAYLCILTNKPIAESEAASSPDWIPSGAQVARVTQSLYDELGPMLSI